LPQAFLPSQKHLTLTTEFYTLLSTGVISPVKVGVTLYQLTDVINACIRKSSQQYLLFYKTIFLALEGFQIYECILKVILRTGIIKKILK